MGPGAIFHLRLNSLPELCCRCSRFWSYLPDGPQSYPVDSLLPGWDGPLGSYGSVSLMDFGLTLLPSLQSCFWPSLFFPLMGLPGWTLHLVRCLPCQGLPVHPVTRVPSEKEKTHSGTCLVFTQKKLCSSDPGFERESDLFDQPL